MPRHPSHAIRGGGTFLVTKSRVPTAVLFSVAESAIVQEALAAPKHLSTAKKTAVTKHLLCLSLSPNSPLRRQERLLLAPVESKTKLIFCHFHIIVMPKMFARPVNSFPNWGLTHFDEILREADGIILSHGNLGIGLPPEKVFLFRKSVLYKCNMAGKPAVLTRVVDSMIDNLRPTRAEATDVANAVLDGSDAILLGAETLRGLYPIKTIFTFGRICSEAEKVFNQDLYWQCYRKISSIPDSMLLLLLII
ncbi:hypothetical protein Ahy_B06g081848 [Arachis hypogaea]|uniref:Pyruvate kinase n=1 Tax=Arachis hypogaea TaxID=3818 RepID=A0A444YMD0_ARAHY|nr:hypothetical protein Ahy_B06g081848 [Arachis hypogaea]